MARICCRSQKIVRREETEVEHHEIPVHFSRMVDTAFSIAMLLIAFISLAYSFSLLRETFLALPMLILSGALFGISCLGLNGSYAVMLRNG